MSEKSVRKYRPLETFWPYVEPPEELSVEEVTNILFIDFFFSNFSIKGIILNISPTLDP